MGLLPEGWREPHPQDRQGVQEQFQRALAGRTPYKVEFRAVGADGKTRWVASRGLL